MRARRMRASRSSRAGPAASSSSARRGRALYVRARGVTAHVGPSRALGALRDLAARGAGGQARSADRSRAGVGTSVGILRGGAARQVIPDEAELHLDLRATTQEGRTGHGGAHRSPPRSRTIPRVSVATEAVLSPPFPTIPGTRRLYELAREVGAALGWRWTRSSRRAARTAASPPRSACRRSMGSAPSCHESCSRRERVELASIVPRGMLFAGLIEAIGAKGVG